MLILLPQGFRNTQPRQIILEELKKVKTHPTADDIYETVRKRLPRISLGTIYRNLSLLSNKGVIQKLERGGVQSRFDGNPKNHYHISCINCGKVDDITTKIVVNIEDVARRATDYKITRHCVEFFGVCKQCRSKKD